MSKDMLMDNEVLHTLASWAETDQQKKATAFIISEYLGAGRVELLGRMTRKVLTENECGHPNSCANKNRESLVKLGLAAVTPSGTEITMGGMHVHSALIETL